MLSQILQLIFLLASDRTYRNGWFRTVSFTHFSELGLLLILNFLTHCGPDTPYAVIDLGSTLAQVMALCLMAPSHYPIQWCLISKILKFHAPQINGLVQERCNSIANALELRLSPTNWNIFSGLILTLWDMNNVMCLKIKFRSWTFTLSWGQQVL